MVKAAKILIGLLLVPFCAGFSWQLAASLVSVAYRPLVPYYFVAGGFTYLLVHFLFKKPILTYVVGHELTHAFFAVLFGGSVKAFQASERGGQVRLTKSNVIITLAPYFFPLYTFVALVFYWIARAAEVPAAEPWLIFAAGATLCFHLVLTAVFLQTDQTDIREHGAFFSYPLIYLFNVLLSAALVRLLLAEDMSYPEFLAGGIMKSAGMYAVGLKKLYAMIAT
jgi:hypothetical protein